MLTAAAVVGSLAGSILMFLLGLYNMYEAYAHGLLVPRKVEAGIAHGANSVISVIEGLDRFLIAIVLLYFAFGVYSLFLHPEREPEQAEEVVAWPSWLRVKQIGQLKQVVAEVIIVILLVLFLRVALQIFQSADVLLTWQQIGTFLSLPVCTMLLAIALKLVELHPKPTAPEDLPGEVCEEPPVSCDDPGPERGAVEPRGAAEHPESAAE